MLPDKLPCAISRSIKMHRKDKDNNKPIIVYTASQFPTIHVCYLLVLKAVVSFITTNISSNGYVVMELMML